VDSLADHAALELGKGACNLKHQLSGWRGRIDCLLIKVQIDAATRLANMAGSVAAGAEAIDRPGSNHVEHPTRQTYRSSV
jgi:hypothetical protein